MYIIEFVPQVRAVFLLFIAICANFLGNTINCGLQKTFTENPIVRHLFLYLIVLFTIDFTSKQDLPLDQVIFKSFVIYLFYIILTKQSLASLVIIIILLISCYLIYIQMNYEKSKKNNTKDYEELLNNLTLGIGVVSIIGFALYLNKQYNDHKDDFDLVKFIFGTNKCESLK